MPKSGPAAVLSLLQIGITKDPFAEDSFAFDFDHVCTSDRVQVERVLTCVIWIAKKTLLKITVLHPWLSTSRRGASS